MFETLKGKLQTVFDGLAKRGALSEADVDAALREVRLALLDADVALPVVKSFIEKLRNEAVRLLKLLLQRLCIRFCRDGDAWRGRFSEAGAMVNTGRA